MEAPQAHCNFCGKHLVMGEILYTTDARVACVDCNRKVDLLVTDQNVGGNILKASIFSLGASVLAVILLLFPSLPFLLLGLVLAVSSVFSAIYAIRAVNQKGDERFTQHVQKDKTTIYVCSIIGIVISAFVLLVITLAFIALLMAPSVDKYQYQGY
jgi:hypothetical protein